MINIAKCIVCRRLGQLGRDGATLTKQGQLIHRACRLRSNVKWFLKSYYF